MAGRRWVLLLIGLGVVLGVCVVAVARLLDTVDVDSPPDADPDLARRQLQQLADATDEIDLRPAVPSLVDELDPQVDEECFQDPIEPRQPAVLLGGRLDGTQRGPVVRRQVVGALEPLGWEVVPASSFADDFQVAVQLARSDLGGAIERATLGVTVERGEGGRPSILYVSLRADEPEACPLA